MTNRILLNAFDMNCVGHQSMGLWRHPRDRSTLYTSMSYWQDLARTLERGLFDGIFLADVTGVYDVYRGTPDAALRSAAQVPANDPFTLVPVMAAATRHLGFGVTASVPYEPPYAFARRISSLDHLTCGRIGWNVVTGYLDSAARATGRAAQVGHDTRYAIADEYMEVVYKLWEGSWADDAVVRDAARGVYADPARVRTVHHDGEHYRVHAVHLCEPSPQRTPVLYQAGSSAPGRAFAARHAECVFVGADLAALATTVDDLRTQAAAHGRTRDDLKIFTMVAVVAAPTDADARERVAEYATYGLPEGGLALMSGWSGIDLGTFDADTHVEHLESNAVRSALRSIGRKSIREWGEYLTVGGAAPVIAGSPVTVADRLEDYMATGIDGFNLACTVMPECFTDFVDLVVPELQRRGVYKTAYAPGTYREKLFGRGARLEKSHPGANFRID